MIWHIVPSYITTQLVFKPYALLLAGVCVLVGWIGAVPFAAAQLSNEKMQQRKAMWREYAMSKEINYCIDVTPGAERMTEHDKYPPDGLCGIGDSVKLNALLCYAGELFACQAVKNSMDDNGRLWRSPVHARPQGWPHVEWKNGRFHYPGNATDFSRDHTLGFLLYLAVTKDTEAARKWLAWLNSTDARLGTIEFVEGLSEDVAREIVNGVECLAEGYPCIKYHIEEVWEDLTNAEKIACGLITALSPPAGVVCPAVIRNGKKLTGRGKIPKYVTLFMPRVCDDLTCEITPDLYALMYSVFASLGLLEEIYVQALMPGHPASKNIVVFQNLANETWLVANAKNLTGYHRLIKAHHWQWDHDRFDPCRA
jgi:hypothetical protein